jgi:TetR/AcrR family transcriptional repressor of multidrug resistance operon
MNEHSFIFVPGMRIRDVNKEKLVKQKAIELMLKEGITGFSMQKLAKACGISVATLYIYYANKEDLIIKIGIEEGKRMHAAMTMGFSPDMPFAEGLKKQWENRAAYALKNKETSAFFENVKHTAYADVIVTEITEAYRPIMKQFTQNAIARKELRFVSFESYWSVAYGPLYTLLKFEQDGKSVGNRPFKFSKKVMYESLELVLKALTP